MSFHCTYFHVFHAMHVFHVIHVSHAIHALYAIHGIISFLSIDFIEYINSVDSIYSVYLIHSRIRPSVHYFISWCVLLMSCCFHLFRFVCVCYHFIHWCNNSFHFILRGFIPFYQIMSIYSIHLFICSFVHINRSLFLSCPFILSHCVSFCAMSLHFSSFQLSPFNFIWFSSFIAYVHWFHSLLHVLYSFIQSFIHAFIHSSIRSFINSCIHSIHLV